MKRRTFFSIIAGLLLSAFQLGVPQALPASGGKRLLLLADADTPGTTALSATLTQAGYEITQVTPEYAWDGTNPALAGFQAVVHLNGKTWATPLPVSAQTALVDFVRNGGGFVGSQWNGYEQAQGQQVDMKDLVLQLWPHPDNCFECAMTWTVVSGQEGHPVLAGVPGSFTFFADAHDAGPQVQFTADPSTVLMRSPGGGPAVTVREFGAGRVVNFSSAANNTTTQTLQDFVIQTLYLNAVQWVSSAPPAALPQCNAPATITPPDAPISFTATAAAGSTVQITGYDCFKFNKSGKRVDKTGSCVVQAVDDTLTILDSGGVGDHITWTVVAANAAGRTGEPVLCEVTVVRPGTRCEAGKGNSTSSSGKTSKRSRSRR
jgi:hypothetical protein